MERITISLDRALAEEFDRLIRGRGYANRSEAIRDILRRELEAERLAREEAPHCVASLSYVYNHHERQLAERLTEQQHHAPRSGGLHPCTSTWTTTTVWRPWSCAAQPRRCAASPTG